MKSSTLPTCLAVVAMLSACHTGPQIEEMDAPWTPAGATVRVEVSQAGERTKQKYVGELLEVRDDGLVIGLPSETKPGPTIVFVPWEIVYRITATELPGKKSVAWPGDKRRGQTIEKFRIISRYPQGLSADLMDRLLANSGQTAMDIIDE
jgi:hypothetical protein